MMYPPWRKRLGDVPIPCQPGRALVSSAIGDSGLGHSFLILSLRAQHVRFFNRKVFVASAPLLDQPGSRFVPVHGADGFTMPAGDTRKPALGFRDRAPAFGH